MKIICTVIFTILLFISMVTFGQENVDPISTNQKTTTEQSNSSKKENTEQAREQITQLLEGALLVRLQTKNKSITALREKGNDKLADKIETDQKKHNMEIVSAFRTLFDFCPVYFFFSDDSQNIKKGKLDQVAFLSESLIPDTNIHFSKTYFLTAEFGRTEQGKSFGALVIMDSRFSQLKRPFPYYVRTFESLPIKRSIHRTVLMMNRKLHKFY